MNTPNFSKDISSELKLAGNFVAMIVSLTFCPIGLLISGYAVGVLEGQTDLQLTKNSVIYQITWIAVNILISVSCLIKSRLPMKEFLIRRFHWAQITYLICGYLFYNEGNGPTEKLNRYIFLFILGALSAILEIYLHNRTTGQNSTTS